MITGRKIRSIKRLRNKKLKELQQKMAQCQKGSRQWQKYRRALRYILGKSEAQLTDALHKTTREFVNWCSDSNVKEVVVGDVEGVERHTSAKKKGNTRKRSTKHSELVQLKLNEFTRRAPGLLATVKKWYTTYCRLSVRMNWQECAMRPGKQSFVTS